MGSAVVVFLAAIIDRERRGPTVALRGAVVTFA
jgi:hypothetical protein